MTESSARVRNVSDTALWAAHFRAEESRRPDAMFRDPYAEKLGAAQGLEMARKLPYGESHAWAWVARTYLFDQLLQQEIAEGADLVLNCAAGLDARPYRMQLPATLQWVEADLPGILAYKTERLAGDRPNCQLERIAVNLADAGERGKFLKQIAGRGKRGVVLTEGLLIYLEQEEVARFARDLSGVGALRRWVLDLHSPRLLRMMQRRTGKALEQVGAPFRFGPAGGPSFFAMFGWKPVRVESMLRTATHFGRPPLFLRLVARIFARGTPNFNRPWSGVCLLQREAEPNTESENTP